LGSVLAQGPVSRLTVNNPSLIAPVVTIISITLSSNKIQNGDILVPANPGPLEESR